MSSVVVVRHQLCCRQPCCRSSSVAVGLLSSGPPCSCSPHSRSCCPCWCRTHPRSFMSTLVCALSTCTVTINNIIHDLLTFPCFHLHCGLTTPEKNNTMVRFIGTYLTVLRCVIWKWKAKLYAWLTEPYLVVSQCDTIGKKMQKLWKNKSKSDAHLL